MPREWGFVRRHRRRRAAGLRAGELAADDGAAAFPVLMAGAQCRDHDDLRNKMYIYRYHKCFIKLVPDLSCKFQLHSDLLEI